MFIVSLPAGARPGAGPGDWRPDRLRSGYGFKRLPCGPSAGAAAADSASPRREVSSREAAAASATV